MTLPICGCQLVSQTVTPCPRVLPGASARLVTGAGAGARDGAWVRDGARAGAGARAWVRDGAGDGDGDGDG